MNEQQARALSEQAYGRFMTLLLEGSGIDQQTVDVTKLQCSDDHYTECLRMVKNEFDLHSFDHRIALSLFALEVAFDGIKISKSQTEPVKLLP
jgi:hypothetical protein